MLSAFRDMAEVLKNRKKQDITISFLAKDRKEVIIRARYDGLFSTVEMGAVTVPAKELRHWLKLFYGADVKTINVNPNPKEGV